MRKQLEEKLAFYAGKIKETKTNDEWIDEAIKSYKQSVKNEISNKDNNMVDEEKVSDVNKLKRKSSDNRMSDVDESKKKKKKRNDDEKELEDSIDQVIIE